MTSQVIVVGEALIDIVVPRHGASSEHVGGSPANVAVGVRRLGHPTTLATHIAQDERGRRITDLLRAEAVELTSGSTTADRTPTATATLDDGGAATYVFDLDWQVDPDLALPTNGHLHTGSFAATLEPGAAAVRQIVERARASCTISYDPNARPSIMGDADSARALVEELIAHCDVVKASDEDIAWFYHGAPADEVLDRWAGLGPRLVIMTRGGAGATVSIGDKRTTMTTAPATVADTVGAGDSFMAGLISGLVDAGYLGGPAARERLATATLHDIAPAIRRGLECGAITVSRPGANPPRRDELPAAGVPKGH